MLKSVFYIITIAGLFLTLMFYKKNEKKESLLKWLGLNSFIVGFIEAFAAGIINFFQIPVLLIFLCFTNIVISVLLYLKTKKNIQAYYWNPWDSGVLLLLIAVISLIAYRHYNGFALTVNYATVDPSVHIKNAEDFVLSHNLDGMYYSKLLNGIFFDLCIPFVGKIYTTKLFVLAELFNLFMSGIVFVAATKDYANTKIEKTLQVILCVAYILGFPLNNMIYGFTYLGVGVSVCLVIASTVQNYLEDTISERLAVIVLMLANYAIFECYVLFVPVIYLSEFLIFTGIYIKNNRRIKNIIRELTVLFLIPILMGFWYTYRGIFTGGVTVGTALTNEGTIYRDFFSNFILLFFLTLYYLLVKIKQKNISRDFYCISILCMGAFLILFLYLGLKGKVSSYYYYKNYYLCWALMFVMLFFSIKQLLHRTPELMLSLGIVVVLIGVLGGGRIEQRINAKNPLFVPEVKSVGLLDIYKFNYEKIKETPADNQFNRLVRYVNRHLENKNIVPVTFFEDTYWFEAYTWTRMEMQDRTQPFLYGKLKPFKEYVKKNNTQYIVVYYEAGNTLYYNNRQYFDKLPKVYENQSGFVAKIQNP